MAQQIVGRQQTLRSASAYAPSIHALLFLRLTLSLVLLLGSVISFFALSWDIQWHTFIGRDRTLTPPHVLMLSGIALAGLAALASVITESVWARRNLQMKTRLTPFAGLFAAPLGTYIAGYAALNSAAGFPLDQYWHTLYGIDVTIWAPFHIMVIAGLALIAFGVAYSFASLINMATSLQAVRTKRVATIGLLVAFATSLCIFSVLVVEGIGPDKFIQLGFTSFSLFPVLEGLLLAGLLGAVAYAVPWRWAATSVVGVALLFMVLNQLVVPPAIIWLMQVEQLTFREARHSSMPPISVLAVFWPLLSLLSAILIDVLVHRARTFQWTRRTASLAIGGAVLLGCLPVTVSRPDSFIVMFTTLDIPGILITFALCVLGIFVGTRLGAKIGQTMSVLER